MIKYIPWRGCLLFVIWIGVTACTLNVEWLRFERPAEEVLAVVTQTLDSAPRTPSPTSTSTNLPQPIPLPSHTPTPTTLPTPTTKPTPIRVAVQRQLTQGGCCVKPFFSADSSTVLFIDKPAAQASVGIYGVDLRTFISASDSPPLFIDDIIGFRSPDQSIVAFPDGQNSRLMRFVNKRTNEIWTIDTLGNWPVFSPDSSYIYWNATNPQGPYDERPTDIWIAKVDGSEARVLLTIYGGGASGWFPDNERLLVTGRSEPIGVVETLMVLSLKDGGSVTLAQEERLRGGSISPGGSWVIYLTTFSGDANNDGLWAVQADNSQRQKLPFFGPYRWLDDETLIFIPPRQSVEEGFALWQMNINTATVTQLTDPAALSINIQDGDWAVSPDGKRVVYVSSLDHNLWLISLP